MYISTYARAHVYLSTLLQAGTANRVGTVPREEEEGVGMARTAMGTAAAMAAEVMEGMGVDTTAAAVVVGPVGRPEEDTQAEEVEVVAEECATRSRKVNAGLGRTADSHMTSRPLEAEAEVDMVGVEEEGTVAVEGAQATVPELEAEGLADMGLAGREAVGATDSAIETLPTLMKLIGVGLLGMTRCCIH
jgi:hypothetical protein